MSNRFFHILVGFLCSSAFLRAAEPQRLTTDGTLRFSPVFNGLHEVVFAVHDQPNLVAIKLLKLKDGSQERLHPSLTAHQFDPAFSADGRYHCFCLSANSPQMVLVIQDKDRKSVV